MISGNQGLGKCNQSKPKAEADYTCRDLDYSGYHKNLIQLLVNISEFSNCACFETYLKDNKHNSLNLALIFARIFVLGHYLFLKAHSFPRATLSENSSLLGTDNNVRGQISEHLYAPNGDYCLYTVNSYKYIPALM